MKLFVFVLLVSVFCSCNNQYPKAENAFDAGREFIDGCLKGDFNKARSYLLQNETNNKQFDKLIDDYRKKNNQQKQEYNNASITVLEEETVSDSIHIIKYKNSFDNIPRTLKVVQNKDGWLVDLMYTFSGNL